MPRPADFAGFAFEPFGVLSPGDLELVAVNIEIRHVITRNLGVADEHCAEVDRAQQPSQTVWLFGNRIGRFADIRQLGGVFLD